MSKSDKLQQKLFSVPPPMDLTWAELITIMHKNGFNESCSGGSHYIFEHNTIDYRCSISRTHPSGILKPYQVKAAKEAIKSVSENFKIGESNE